MSPLAISEKDFQATVIELLQRYGFKVAHFRPAMTGRTYVNKRGEQKQVWVTAVQADGKGFPDIVAIQDHPPRFVPEFPFYHRGLAWEFKAKGKATPEQQEWLRLFELAGFHSRVWYPKDWDDIVELVQSWQ